MTDQPTTTLAPPLLALLFAACTGLSPTGEGDGGGALDAADGGPEAVKLSDAPFCGELTQGLWLEPDGRRAIWGICQLRSQADIDAFNAEEIDEVAGRLELDGNGTLYISSAVLETVDTLGLLTVIGRQQLGLLSLPALTLISGGVEIDANRVMTRLDLPALERVEGNLSISGNDLLPQCQVDALLERVTIVGNFRTDHNCDDCPCADGGTG